MIDALQLPYGARFHIKKKKKKSGRVVPGRREKKKRGRMSQRQQREIKDDIKKEQTEKDPAALEC